jgi:hypothetical protein
MRQDLDLGHISGCSIGKGQVWLLNGLDPLPVSSAGILPNATKYAQFWRLIGH